MSSQSIISIGEIDVSNELPFTLFGGMNVIESRELALEIAAYYKEVTSKLGIPFIFKALLQRLEK